MTTDNELCTFVASVRVDMRMIASIGEFMLSRGVFVGSTGKIASEAVKILSNTTQKEFPVRSHSEAIIKLRKMGYGDCLEKGTRYYDALYGQVDLEQQAENTKDNIDTEVKKQVAEYNKEHSYAAPADTAGVESILAPTEDETEPEQIKVRTPEDETKDIKKLRTAMAIPDGAPLEVLEENKTLKTNRS